MARKENQKLKLIYTLDILKKYSDEENPINALKIAEYLADYGIEAERKSIYNDIKVLEDYGCDIIKSSSKKGWFIGSREFEVPEIYLLTDAVRSAKFISSKKSRELLNKLNSMLSIHQAKKIKNSVFFAPNDKCGNEELYYSIDTITSAIESKKQIKLNYSSREFSQNRQVERKYKEMTLNPYALTWQDDHYYLICNYSKYDNLIHLRLDRISSVVITDVPVRHFSEVSEYTEFFDTADYTKKLFSMFTGTITDIHLRCRREITEQVLDRFTEDIFITDVTDEQFSFRVKAVISDALVTWIINYGKDLTVLKPDNLKDMVKNRALEVLSNYGDTQ